MYIFEYTLYVYITLGVRMVRTQIYLTEEEKKGIADAALARGVSQSDLIRQAIDVMLEQQGRVRKTRILDEIAGVWADRDDIPDIRHMRTGWRGRAGR